MQKITPPILVSEAGYNLIRSFIKTQAGNQKDLLQNFEAELERAKILPPQVIPSNVVGMFSTVEYENVSNGKVQKIEITSPEDANVEEGRVSVLAPVGAALIGLRVGQEITWPLPDGKTGRFRVKNVIQKQDSFEKFVNAN